jgi:PhzF family phenazine biosynthesis protein
VRLQIFQVDAFTRKLFKGNPAAVMPMESFPPDDTLQALAAENNLAETAFIVRAGREYQIRWFTPKVEVPLCGHATLASAAVVMEKLEPDRTEVIFRSASGPLRVWKSQADYVLDFPSRPSERVSMSLDLTAALGSAPEEVFSNEFNYLAVFKDARLVRELKPDMAKLACIDRPGVIVTAPGDCGFDFLSRYFAPAKGIPEDPVTGAAHCMLAPYWSRRTGKDSFRAYQASPRGGEVICRLKHDRVELQGACVFYMEGTVEL